MKSAYLGRNRIITSPSPVATAAPTVSSAYAPAPTMGESPTRLFGKAGIQKTQQTFLSRLLPGYFVRSPVGGRPCGNVAVHIYRYHTDGIVVTAVHSIPARHQITTVHIFAWFIRTASGTRIGFDVLQQNKSWQNLSPLNLKLSSYRAIILQSKQKSWQYIRTITARNHQST